MVRRFSHTSLQTFRNCPRRFWFEYVEKPDIAKKVYAHMQLGTIVHRQLAWAYRASSDGVDVGLETLLGSYDDEWRRLDPKSLEVSGEYLAVDDYIANGRRMLQTFHDRYYPFRQGVLIGIEQNLDFTLPNTPFAFVAKVDRVLKISDGVAEIADYKTGGSNLPSPADPSFRTQMGLYQLAVQAKYPQFREIELVQHWLKQDEEVRTRLRADELDELTLQLRDEAVATRQAERLNDWPAKEGNLCGFCDYVALCPAKRHRLLLEAEGDQDKTTVEAAAELADRFLDVHARSAQLKAEEEALKEDLKRAARDLQVDKLSGRRGDVVVKLGTEEKLPTKSGDRQAFADLSELVRGWGPEYEGFFRLDGDAVMKELYLKDRLTDEQRTALANFVVIRDKSRITVRKRDDDDDDGVS